LLIFKEKSYVNKLSSDLASSISTQLNQIQLTLPVDCAKLYLVFFILKGVVMKLRPIRDRIVIRLLEAEAVTASGLIIPDSAAEKPSQGEVLAAGSGRVAEDGTVVPMVVQPGDRVLFGKHAGQTVKIDGEDYHILREDDVMAIVQQGE
jgi:chaperonin GroES